MFNTELLLADMSQVLTVPPNVKYAELFVKLQREAGEACKGLWAAGAASSSGTGAAAAPAKYVGNANSKKFHGLDCESAAKIALRNRAEFGTREAVVAAGYVPCKVCIGRKQTNLIRLLILFLGGEKENAKENMR